MNRKWIYLLMSSALLLGVHVAGAQEPPPGPPPGPPDILGPGGPIGPRVELLGFGEMRAGKMVTGAPYSAVAVTETKQTLSDGNTIDNKMQANVFRDSQGRTRREVSGTGFLGGSGQARSAVLIHDPVAGTTYILHADRKVAEQLPTRQGGPNNPNAPREKFEARMQKEIADGSLKKEDLGTQTVNGVSAQGTRYTRVIPAGQIGNANPITVVNEQWYSPDLQVIVKTSRSDPRVGQITYNLTNIQRSEPAASLFSVPSDYTVKQAEMPRHGKHGRGAPPAPPSDAPPPPPGE